MPTANRGAAYLTTPRDDACTETSKKYTHALHTHRASTGSHIHAFVNRGVAHFVSTPTTLCMHASI